MGLHLHATDGTVCLLAPGTHEGTVCLLAQVLSAVPVQAPAQPLRRCQHVRMRTHAKRTLNIVSNVSAARSTSPYIACDASRTVARTLLRTHERRSRAGPRDAPMSACAAVVSMQ